MKSALFIFAIFFLFQFGIEIEAQQIHFTNPTNGEIVTSTTSSSQTEIHIFLQFNYMLSNDPNLIDHYIKLFRPPYSTQQSPGLTYDYYLVPGTYTWRLELWENYLGLGSHKVAEQTITFYVKHTIKISNNFTGGNLNIDGATNPSGTNTFKFTDNNLLVGAIDQPSGNNYYLWNQSGIYDSEWRKRPNGELNFLPISGGTPRNYNYTVASNDNGAEIQGALRKRFNISRNQQTEFDGMIPAGVVTYVVEQNSGQITAPPFTHNNRVYNFYEWDNGSTNNSRTITPSGHTAYTAYYKTPHLSEDPVAYHTNGQRKVARTTDGNLFSTYTSLNRVWLERSNDNGLTWNLWHNYKALGRIDEGSPSIDQIPWSGNYSFTAIVYPEWDYAIMIDFFTSVLNTKFLTETLILNYGDNLSLPITPVIAISENRILVVCNGGRNQSGQEGMGFFYGEISFVNNNIEIDWLYDSGYDLIPGTNQYAINPTVIADKNSSNPVFYIAWQQGYAIKYCTLTESGGSISFSAIETPSSNSPYSENRYPSISLANGNPVLSWTVSGMPVAEKIAAKDNFERFTSKAIVCRKGTNWGDYQLAGNDVTYTNNNSVSSAQEKTVIAWSKGTTNPQGKWFTRTGSVYSNPCNLSHSGVQTQVITGSDYQYMTSMVFNNNQLPYYFSRTTTNFNLECSAGGDLEKITNLSDSVVTYGRAGITNINDISFVFNVGDVIVGDSIIRFTEKPDTLVYSTYEELNQFTRTDDFQLNNSSQFYFSNLYYVVNKELADSSLTENDNVNFKVELVNSITGQVAGVFDNITYDKNNLEKYDNISYQVNCSGIQPGEYHLRLVTTVNGEADYALANIINETVNLDKRHFQTINYDGSEMPVTYSLEQNYPNPFNPTTTIRYQIPQDGMVTLKVYDILGSEVATLVNEQKSAGRYEVNFNASRLASGVYIYKLASGSYIQSKKMLLIK